MSFHYIFAEDHSHHHKNLKTNFNSIASQYFADAAAAAEGAPLPEGAPAEGAPAEGAPGIIFIMTYDSIH